MLGGGASGTALISLRGTYSIGNNRSETYFTNSPVIFGMAGSTTSFGNVITANGGELFQRRFPVRTTSCIGQPGYNGIIETNTNLYTDSAKDFFPHEYGAGGTAMNPLDSPISTNDPKIYYPFMIQNSYVMISEFKFAGGLRGQIKMTVADISENTNIAITVGKGGTMSNWSDNDIKPAFQYISLVYNADSIISCNDVTPCRDSNISYYDNLIARITAACLDGKDGVVILQYMGG